MKNADSASDGAEIDGALVTHTSKQIDQLLISIASEGVLSLIFGREAWTSVIQRTQKSFVEFHSDMNLLK